MVKINLLPHREQKRRRRHQAFYAKLGAAAMVGSASVLAGIALIELAIDHQDNINQVIITENNKLDAQVKEVATLKQEIDALKARQRAVENLQNDRNQSIYLMDDLVRHVPEGIYLYSVLQSEKTVTLNGYAQSNEHVSEFMRNIENNAQWTESPQLQEIRSAYRQRTNNANHVFDFTMTIALKTFATPHTDDDTDDDDDEGEDDDSTGDAAGEDAMDDDTTDTPQHKAGGTPNAPTNNDGSKQPRNTAGAGAPATTPAATSPAVAPSATPASTPAATPGTAPAQPAPVTAPAGSNTELPSDARTGTPASTATDSATDRASDTSSDNRATPIEDPVADDTPDTGRSPQP